MFLQEFIAYSPDTLITAIPPLPRLIAEAIAAIVSSVSTIDSISHYVMDN